MTYTDDIRTHFRMATAFKGFDGPDSVADALSEAGIDTIGDLQQLSLPELRRFMDRTHIDGDGQRVFLEQLRSSRIYPRGVTDPDELII